MVRRGILLSMAIFVLVSCSAIVFAQSDSSGNINVEVTRIDPVFSYAVLFLISLVIIAVLITSLVMLLRRRSLVSRIPITRVASTPVTSEREINLKKTDSSGFRREGYYDAVFRNPLPQVDVSDEKSKPVSFINDGPGDKDVARYLKEDEKIVVNVLKMKHNSCSQATLRVVTDFSKAKLSRLLTELETRGVVYKEQRGRKNLITLRG